MCFTRPTIRGGVESLLPLRHGPLKSLDIMLVHNKMLHMAEYRRYIVDISSMYRRYRVDLGACEIGDIESINRRYRYAPQKNRSAARIQRKTPLNTTGPTPGMPVLTVA